MTTTRINHTGHNHPSTTAARTACRAAMATTTEPTYVVGRIGVGTSIHRLTDAQANGAWCGTGYNRRGRKTRVLVTDTAAPFSAITCARCAKV